jgi:hypothetical protein
MKRIMSLWAGIFLFACALEAQGASAASTDTDVEGFLASLRTGVPVSTSEGMDSYCSVQLTCDVGGYPLSCESWSGDCHSTSNSVTCDGVEQTCPICRAVVTCPCYGNTIECFGWSYCRSRPLLTPFVECDGYREDCWPPMSQCPK